VCRSYSDLNFGVTFLERSVYICSYIPRDTYVVLFSEWIWECLHLKYSGEGRSKSWVMALFDTFTGSFIISKQACVYLVPFLRCRHKIIFGKECISFGMLDDNDSV